MLMKVKYYDNRFDLVKGSLLSRFLVEGKVKEFFRYSEHRWVTVGRDQIRTGGGTYSGPERRAEA
jgi:hypothetical protein